MRDKSKLLLWIGSNNHFTNMELKMVKKPSGKILEISTSFIPG